MWKGETILSCYCTLHNVHDVGLSVSSLKVKVTPFLQTSLVVKCELVVMLVILVFKVKEVMLVIPHDCTIFKGGICRSSLEPR